MRFRQPFDVKPSWLSSISHPEGVRYLAFALMFAGIGSAVVFTRAAVAAHPIYGIGHTCLSADASVTLRACDGSDAQKWNSAQDSTIEHDGKCLQIDRKGGTPVALAACDNSKYQGWHENDGHNLINLSNASCLQPVIGTGTESIRAVITAACNGSQSELWDTQH